MNAQLSARQVNGVTAICGLWDDKAKGKLCPDALSKNLILLEQKECRFSLKWLISAFFFYLNT